MGWEKAPGWDTLYRRIIRARCLHLEWMPRSGIYCGYWRWEFLGDLGTLDNIPASDVAGAQRAAEQALAEKLRADVVEMQSVLKELGV